MRRRGSGQVTTRFRGKMTHELATAAGRDAGDAAMRAAGRTQWNEDDWNVAAALVWRLMAPDDARKRNLPGGRADGRPLSDFDPAELARGAEAEREHTDSPGIAQQIAADHLAERPDYYDRLAAFDADVPGRPLRPNSGTGAVDLSDVPDNVIIASQAPFGSVTVDELDEEDEIGRPPGRRANPRLSGIMPPRAQEAVVSTYNYFPPLVDALIDGQLFEKLIDAAEFGDTRDKMLRVMEAFIVEAERLKKGQYVYAGRAFYGWLEQLPGVQAAYAILATGWNMKIGKEFYEFSAIPGVTCPGAGTCYQLANGKRGWCYSFKALVYAKAFFRRLQNTILLRLREGQELIRQAVEALPEGKTCRLYVDGDFDSADSLGFWMKTVQRRPDLHFYGYSKSWELLIGHDQNGGRWPENYWLNVSSGSRYDQNEELKRQVLALPITRGPFFAVREAAHKYSYPDAKKLTPQQAAEMAAQQRLDRKAYEKVLRAAAQAQGITRPWACPGYCGACLADGAHACGAPRMRGVNIVLGVH